MFGYSRDGTEPSFPAEWRPDPAARPEMAPLLSHDWDGDGRCTRRECGHVHFLDATGPCPGAPP